jgi:hypothetical protein
VRRLMESVARGVYHHMQQSPRIMMNLEQADRLAPRWVHFFNSIQTLHNISDVPFTFLAELVVVSTGGTCSNRTARSGCGLCSES